MSEEDEITLPTTIIDKCRACLNKADNMKALSLENVDGNYLIPLFTRLTNFEWVKDAKIPSFLCLVCEETLRVCHNFQIKCKKSNDIIQRFLSNEIEEKLPEVCVENHDPLLDETTQKLNEIEEFENYLKSFEGNKESFRMRFKQIPNEQVEQAIEDLKKENEHVQCIVCDYVMTCTRALSTHVAHTHKEIKDQWCCHCNKIVENLTEHKNLHNKTRVTCQFCGRQVSRKQAVQHLRAHSDIREFDCKLCNRRFMTASNCRKHYKTHTIQSKKSFNDLNITTKEITGGEAPLKEGEKFDNVVAMQNFCKECNKKVRSLSVHLKTFHGGKAINKPQRIFPCTLCEKKYRSHNRLQLHIMQHAGATRFKCKFCNRCCVSKSHLEQHERTHTGEKPYICSVCGKGLTQQGSLTTHMLQHTGKTVECKICQRKFCRTAELNVHLRKHSGYRPHLCQQCGKTFTQKSHYNDHMKIHSNYRPFKCEYCDKAFKHKSLLKSHNNIHLGYKPFKCTMCSYECQKRYRLSEHMKQHNEIRFIQKDFICKVCQRGFSTQTLLNSHMSSSHNAII